MDEAHETVGPIWLKAVVTRVCDDAGAVRILDLALPSGAELPPFEPGSHVAVRCGAGLVRHYSLCGRLDERRSYRIAVKREAQSRGGSIWIHQNVHEGAALLVSTPRNNFPLVNGRPAYLFLSGGIGLTPMLPMLELLRGQGTRARLVHLCRAPEELAFRGELAALGRFHDVHIHVDTVAGGLCDIAGQLGRKTAGTEVYCCGPTPLMNAVRDYGRAEGQLDHYHFEVFSAGPAVPRGSDEGFTVVLESSGQEIPVAAGETIMSALRKAGVFVDSECEEGVCGTCVTRVLSGTPDHRDHYLSEKERDANGLVATCVSRARSLRLVLDI